MVYQAKELDYREVKVSIRMFLDDFIKPPFRDYVVYYLQKVEQTLKLRVHHVFIYDEVDTMAVKEFTDFIGDKLIHKTEIIPVGKVRPQDHIWMNLLPVKHKDLGQYTYASYYKEPADIFQGLKVFNDAAVFVTTPKPEKDVKYRKN
jgi:hypothetical protein|tara:strand:- start:19 stop:459 length:441 start_codon:yes stop_codon:yes gene_type:complete